MNCFAAEFVHFRKYRAGGAELAQCGRGRINRGATGSRMAFASGGGADVGVLD